GLKDHPVLFKTNGSFQFRFEFFNSYFKSVAIFNILSSNSRFQITERVINTLCEDCIFNSVLFKFLVVRLSKDSVDFERILSHAEETIKKIKGEESNNLKNRNKKAISNILLIILKLDKRNLLPNSQILFRLFGNPQYSKFVIENFYFIDVPIESDVILDFSGMFFTHSQIDNYASFFKCIFDENTFFE